MKVLVTGGAGFIASHVVDRYLAAGHEVVVVDDLSTGSRANVDGRSRFHRLDIRSPELSAVFAAERPEVVNHHAAQASVRVSVEHPDRDAEVNILGSLNVLRCCREYRVRHVIYASTGGAVYGDTTQVPTPESHPVRPASPYGVSKLTVERYLGCWESLYGIRTIALRYANVYGPRQNPQGEAGVVAIFTSRLLQGQPSIINGDGRQTRDYVYVADVAEANMAALERPGLHGVFNIGTGVETSVVELFQQLRDVIGRSADAAHGPAKEGEQRRSALDSSIARRELGWSPAVRLREGLAATVECFRAASPQAMGRGHAASG
jgi:UDP-glucose 4-epimerase